MLVLMLPRVSSPVSGFPVASPCLWGKLKNLSFSKVSKQVVISFCVAGAALCDIPTCLITCRKSFSVARAVLLHRFHKMSCSFRGRRSILEISVVILRGKRSTPHYSTLYTSHSRLYIPHFLLYTPHSTLYTPHFTLHTLHSTLSTLHFTLQTLHSTLCTLHSTLYTLHSTLHTPDSILYTLHSTLYTPDYTLHSTLSNATFFHIPQSPAHWYGSRGKMYCSTRLFKQTVSQKCSTWLHIHVFRCLYHEHTCEHSGSWAASCFGHSLNE